jgi:hypothetical protein
MRNTVKEKFHEILSIDLRINLRFCRVKRVYSLVDENKAIAMEARQVYLC